MESRLCRQCAKTFSIDDNDRKFYEKMSVTAPTLCPDCRLQRRLAWLNERTLYFRTCDLTGKKILSTFPPDAAYKTYHIDEWYSDKWNALDSGREFDFNRPFFEQFDELMRVTPLMALSVVAVQNCDYVNQVGYSKNCYFIVDADYDEDCMFSYRIFYSKTCVDCIEVFRCERCYECLDCENCFNLKFSQLCRQCSDSAFLYDCRGVTNCFGCVGLRQKQNCWFNEQLSKEEFGRRRAAFDFCDSAAVSAARERFELLKLQHPRKAFIGEMNENVSGNYISHSKDCLDSFEIRETHDCRYGLMLRSTKDCMDYTVWGANAEKIYDSQTCGQNIMNLRFCSECWDGVRDLTYCVQCVLGSANLFGCVSVQRGEYRILNKQYSRKEYEKLVPRIIEHMKKDGQWGEFFPPQLSPYAYNETAAQEYFPLTKEAAAAAGLKWRENLPFTIGKETKKWNDIPAQISQIPDTIINEVFACDKTSRNFRITAQELIFYREMKLPLPRLHPDERHSRRVQMRNPRKLFYRTCAKCQTPIQTTYAPDRPETVYCEKCYLSTVY